MSKLLNLNPPQQLMWEHPPGSSFYYGVLPENGAFMIVICKVDNTLFKIMGTIYQGEFNSLEEAKEYCNKRIYNV